MATEIERKFLLSSDDWRRFAGPGVRLAQGYLASEVGCSVRVRVAGDAAWLNIKGATVDIARAEFEYPIPLTDGQEILATLARKPFIEKTRYDVVVGDHVWEIDEFHGDNDGLIVAEIELGAVDEIFDIPQWVGREVSDEPRYLNAALARHPFKSWT
jgi:adenylate cyclase